MTDTAALTQGSNDWLLARVGKVTASRVADVTARTKCGVSAKRDNYMAELIIERLTGAPFEQYVSAAMARGTELEPDAAAAYAFYANCDLDKVGFVAHPRIAMAGASPDRTVGADGLVEFKVPNTATHLAWLLGAPVDDEYVKQMQWQMACVGRAWCDFASYDPRLPGAMALFVQRVPRDDVMIAALETEVVKFLAEVDAKVAALNAKFGTGEAAPAAESLDGIPAFLRRAS